MRLIDADAFFENFPELAIEPYINTPTVAEIFKSGSAVAVIPIGEWKRHDEWRNGEYIGGFYHVNCPEIESGAAIFSKWESNFCPNCGADMRGGDAE